MKTRVIRLFAILAIAASSLASCSQTTIRPRDKYPNDNNGGREPSSTVTLSKRSDWIIKYMGREDYVESDGYVSRVEKIDVLCPQADYYMIRTISPTDLKELYNNDLKEFFETEAKYLREDAQNYGEKVTDYLYYEESHSYLFDRMLMGEWKLFLIGMTEKGYITGSYTESSVTLQEETPSDDYLKWIGNWTVTGKNLDGNSVSYDLSIEKDEANITYIVNGWETGESIDKERGTVMDQEYLIAQYDYYLKNLYFRSQYLGTYTENNVNLDELFLGKVDYQGGGKDVNGIYVITDENLDLGAAILKEDGQSAEVKGCDVIVTINNKEVTLPFIMMQYFAGYMSGNNAQYSEYNLNVPTFALEMKKAPNTRTSFNRSQVERRPATRASVHHSQARVHERRNSKVAKAVKVR
jgi:hypothetical protein